jgi:phage tail protein X
VSSQQFITHITASGERWDLLAWNYYGDPTQFGPIVMANPMVPIEPVFEAGILLLIPILQEASVVPADLPPWKQITS